MELKSEQIILGMDPGTNLMGYGLILCKGKRMEMLQMGVIDLSKFDNHHVKLKTIFDRTVRLIDQYHPDHLAIEAPFYGQNVQSMLKLGKAQGVAIAAALSRDLSFTEYTPKKMKQSITGSGNASKEQVARMLQSLLKFKEIPKNLDATDGLAAAVCHFFQGGKTDDGKKSYGSWKSFISDNPKKIKR